MDNVFSAKANKKPLIAGMIIILLIVLGVAGYLYWKMSATKNAAPTAEDITNSATKGVLPSLEVNPLENQPDINPASNANPIKDIKTNPF